MFSSPEKNSKKLGNEGAVAEKVSETQALPQKSSFDKKVDEQQKAVGNLDENEDERPKNQVEKNNDLRKSLGRDEKKDDDKSEAFDWDEGQKRLK